MTMRHPVRALIAVLAVVVIAAAAFLFWPRGSSRGEVIIRYGITPYQDSALPIVAERRGWYAKQGLKVEFVPLSWDQVMPALRSGAIDVAIYNVNSFMP